MKVRTCCPVCGGRAIFIVFAQEDEWICNRCKAKWSAEDDALKDTKVEALAASLSTSDTGLRRQAMEFLSGSADGRLLSQLFARVQRRKRSATWVRVPVYCCVGWMALSCLTSGIFMIAPLIGSVAAGRLDAMLMIGFPLVIFGFPLALGLAWTLKRRAADRRAASVLQTVIQSRTSAGDFGALAIAARDPRLRGCAVQKMMDLAPAVSPEQGRDLTAGEASAVADVLARALASRELSLCRACIVLLAETSSSDALPVLESIESLKDPLELVSQARRARQRILAKMRDQQESKHLLRASAADTGETDTLLRAAGPGEQSEEQLLRRAPDAEGSSEDA